MISASQEESATVAVAPPRKADRGAEGVEQQHEAHDGWEEQVHGRVANLFIPLRTWLPLAREAVAAGLERGHDRVGRPDERGVGVADRGADPRWRDGAARHEVAVGVHGEEHHQQLRDHDEQDRRAADVAERRASPHRTRLRLAEIDMTSTVSSGMHWLAHGHVRLGAFAAERAVGQRLGADSVAHLLQHVELGACVAPAGAG